MTLFFILSSKDNNLSFSDPTNLVTGIFVHLDIISATDSSVTVSDRISDLLFSSNSFNSRSNLGISP